MLGLMRIILYALLAYIVYKSIRFFQKLGQKSPSSPKSKQISGLMVKDAICNTYLPQEDAIKEIQEGKEYFFCSKECCQKFLESRKTGDNTIHPVE
jgi:YHS domain-containing protein